MELDQRVRTKKVLEHSSDIKIKSISLGRVGLPGPERVSYSEIFDSSFRPSRTFRPNPARRSCSFVDAGYPRSSHSPFGRVEPKRGVGISATAKRDGDTQLKNQDVAQRDWLGKSLGRWPHRTGGMQVDSRFAIENHVAA